MIPAEQRDEWRRIASICQGAPPHTVALGRAVDALLDALEAAERERDLYEVDSAGLTSVCRALADVWPTSETMSASEAVYALAERADAAEGRARHLALSRADENTRANVVAGEALRHWTESQRLRDGITALADELLSYDCTENAVPESVDVPDDYELGIADAGERVRALLNPTERPTP